MKLRRIIGRYVGQQPGPLLIVMAGIHGNEPAGLKALDLVFKMLEVEPITNPDFVFHGSIVGIAANMPALKAQQRYIDVDMNRIWLPEIIERVELADFDDLFISEEIELKKLIRTIKREIKLSKAEKVVFLDLHTTTAHGGIFSIVSDNPLIQQMAIQLHAPVVTGMGASLKGTTQEFFNHHNLEAKAVGFVFESGQHQDPKSVNRAIAALINFMRTLGCISPEAVENVHDDLLTKFSANLPKVVKLDYLHRITPEDGFEMLPGYQNFQRISKGEVLAVDKKGPIHSPQDGLILMPLYQKQGEDGFFIVSEVKD